MTNPVQNSSAASDLAYIRRIMEQTRRAVAMSGDYFIIWGVIVLLGLLGDYLFIRLGPSPGWAWGALWGGLMLIGWALTLLCIRRDSERVSPPIGRMLGMVWGACSIAMIVLCFAGIPLGVIPPNAVGPITTSVVGIGVFLTGSLMGTAWVRNLAFGWWLAAVAELIWHGPVQLLIGAITIVLFYVLPGVVLNRQARRTTKHQ